MSKKEECVIKPVRSFMSSQSTTCPIKWRYGNKPDYTEADKAWSDGKLCNHLKDSIEMVVENLVKTWEFEASHKIDETQWGSIDPVAYKISANDNPEAGIKESIDRGNYNLLLKDQSLHYEAEKLSFDDSHAIFRNAMNAFPWEVLKVHKGPPTVIFDWRHWGYVQGEYVTSKGEKVPASGKLVELYGYAIVEVDLMLKIKNIKTYFDPKPFFQALEEGISTDDIPDKNILQFETSKHIPPGEE